VEIPVALRPSAILSAALVASHAAALGGLLASALPGWAMACAATGLGISLWHGMRRHAVLRSPRSVVGLRLRDDGTVNLDFRDGSSRLARVHPASSVLGFLTVALLNEPGRRWATPVVIAGDSADPDDLRRLRVWMRFRVRFSAEGGR
jgi:toxin CptA